MPADILHSVPNAGQVFIMVAGAAAIWAGNVLKTIPLAIKAFLFRKLTVSLYLTNSEPIYEWIADWMHGHDYSKKAASVSVSSRMRLTVEAAEESDTATDTSKERIDIMFIPAPGSHFFWYKKRPVWFLRTVEKQEMGQGWTQTKPRETITVRLLGHNQAILRELIQEIVEARLKEQSKSRVVTTMISESDGWQYCGSTTRRAIDSVYLADGMVEDMLGDIRNFCTSKKWYRQTGIPFRRGYLLYGPPGSGKSSTILALASELRMPVYILDLTASGMSDSKLVKLMQTIPENSIVLIEDVDSAFTKRDDTTEKASKITFSGLLNALDGILAGEGRILFMTTNHRENLDAALIRPGRVDREFLIGLPNEGQVLRLVHAYRPSEAMSEHCAAEYAREAVARSLSMAAISGNLLSHRHADMDGWREFIDTASRDENHIRLSVSVEGAKEKSPPPPPPLGKLFSRQNAYVAPE